MASGIWPAVSGAVAQQKATDTVANNLANVDTPTFKKDAPTFKEYLSVLEREPAALDIPRGPIKDKDFYPLDGRDQSFVLNDGTYTDFRQGHMKVTQNPLDLALHGKGFFEVSTPNGIRLTRHGSLQVGPTGILQTSEGYPVLSAQPGGLASAQPNLIVQPGQGGPLTQGGVAVEPDLSTDPAVVARQINLGDVGTVISVNSSGDIYAGDQLIARLSVVEFEDLNQLHKDRDRLYLNTNPAAVANTNINGNLQTQVRQGMIETSNVNPAEEMTKLINAHRLYEHNLRAIKTYDAMMEKEVNHIGKRQ